MGIFYDEKFIKGEIYMEKTNENLSSETQVKTPWKAPTVEVMDVTSTAHGHGLMPDGQGNQGS